MNQATFWLQLRRTAALTLVLLAWEGISALGWVDPFYAPPPSAIGGSIAQLFIDGEIYKHLQATFGAALLGLFLGLIGGALLGFIAALARPVAELLEPVMAMLNAIPRVILAPLFIIWLGIGIASKVALSFILVVVLTFFAVYNGIRDVDTRLVERVKTLSGGLGDGQPQGGGGLCLHRRRGGRVRRLQSWPGLSAGVCPEHL